MVSYFFQPLFAEHIHKVMIVFSNMLMLMDLRSGHGVTSDLRSEIQSWNVWASSLLVRNTPAALMSVTLGVSMGYWKNWIGISGTFSGSFGSGAWWQKCLHRGWHLKSCWDGCWKKMLPIPSQLRDCSRWASGILVTIGNSGPMEWHKKSEFEIPSRKTDLQV